jgi:ABC-type lipoprotein export system ATPase subunit
MPAIELRGVVKGYGGLRPLRIQQLSVGEGERVAVLGLDGGAAETLLNLITGSHLPDSGEVVVGDRSTASIQSSEEWLAFVDRFGIISPRVVLLDSMSAAQNLAIPFTLDLEPVPSHALCRVRSLAGEVGLADASLHVPVAQLAPYEHALIRLARALALQPAVLLLEHVTAALPDDAVAPFAHAVVESAGARRAAVLALTADSRFADALDARVLTLHAASGALRPARRWRRWFS